MSVVLITGGTGAIGEALVAEFSQTDDAVFTYCKSGEKAAEIEKKYRCKGFFCDVTDENSACSAVSAVLREFSRVDILVNNAGISLIKPFNDTELSEWEKIISTNLTGCFLMTRAASADMIRRKSGAIINISSVWGVYGASCEAAYSASKAGIIGFTRALAKELGPSGITVNAVAPGVIESPMNSNCLTEEELSALSDKTPLGRLGKPSEVAKAVRALAENRFITGQVLGVDGGFC